MQGVHAFEPKAKASIDLESFVAADHFLRRVDRVLDLSFIRDLTAPRYAVQQGPAVDRSGGLLSHAAGGVLFRRRLGTATLRRCLLQSRLPLVLPLVADG